MGVLNWLLRGLGDIFDIQSIGYPPEYRRDSRNSAMSETNTIPLSVIIAEDTLPPGASFEQEVAFALRKKIKGQEGILFQNVIVPQQDKTAEIDLVALLPDRFFVVECKDYAGTIYCNGDRNRDWIQYLGGMSYKFYSPVRQNATHIKALCTYLGVGPDKCISFVVFSNRSTLHDVPEDTEHTAVLSYDEFLELGLKPVGEQFSEKVCDYFTARLSKAMCTTDTQRREHTEYAKSMKEQSQKMQRSGVICPECGHTMIKRRSRQGRYFWGCAMYPVCKGSRPLDFQ